MFKPYCITSVHTLLLLSCHARAQIRPLSARVRRWVGGGRHGQYVRSTSNSQTVYEVDRCKSKYGSYPSRFPRIVCIRSVHGKNSSVLTWNQALRCSSATKSPIDLPYFDRESLVAYSALLSDEMKKSQNQHPQSSLIGNSTPKSKAPFHVDTARAA